MSANDSTRRCKKYGKGRGNGKHHARRDRIADPTKASEAQTKRAVNRKARRGVLRSQSHTKAFGVLGRDRDRSVITVGEARPRLEEQFPARILRRPGMMVPRAVPIGDNTTTVAEVLQQALPATVISDGDDMLAAPVVTDAARDEALVALAKVIDTEVAALLAQPIEELELSVRPYNVLKREGVNSIGELVGKTETQLMDYRNFGQKSIDEVKEKLAALNPPLSLKADTPAAD